MARFTIKEIETLSGIRSHTLRIWEQRYGILKPGRTDTNIRYYNDQDLKQALNISILNAGGYKISAIARMTPGEMQQAVLTAGSGSSPDEAQVQTLVSTMLELDENGFSRELATGILQRGVERAMAELIFPLLNRVGLLWQTGCIHVAHEHFITNLVKQKLYVAIDGQAWKEASHGERYLLFLREGEPHEIGLLLANYMLRVRGHKVLYLGQGLPLAELREAVAMFQPQHIVTALTNAFPEGELHTFITTLAREWPDARIACMGRQVDQQQAVFPAHVSVIQQVHEFAGWIEEREHRSRIRK